MSSAKRTVPWICQSTAIVPSIFFCRNVSQLLSSYLLNLINDRFLCSQEVSSYRGGSFLTRQRRERKSLACELKVVRRHSDSLTPYETFSKKTAVAYGADLLAFGLNGEVVSGHHSLENLVLSWAAHVVGDDCLEIHVLLMFSPLHPYTHTTQRLVWMPWCDSRNRASQYQIEATSWQRRADRTRAE